MDALVEIGRVPEAAAEVGITLNAGRERLRRVRLRMAGHKPEARLAAKCEGVSTITACIRWAQFTQGGA